MDAPLTVRYATTRAELWRFYLHAWRNGLWRQHAAIAVFLLLAGVLFTRGAPLAAGAVSGAGLALVAVAFLFAWPQLRYKPQERVLTIAPSGVTTEIAGKSGSWAWSDIAAVEESPGEVILRNRSGNAFIVPARAFAAPARRKVFAERARRWRQGGEG